MKCGFCGGEITSGSLICMYCDSDISYKVKSYNGIFSILFGNVLLCIALYLVYNKYEWFYICIVIFIGVMRIKIGINGIRKYGLKVTIIRFTWGSRIVKQVFKNN